jgi:DNA-binding response OmpR family regulator
MLLDRTPAALTPTNFEIAAAVREAPDVVLVDDDRELSTMIQFGLEAAGRSVASYDSGPEALAALLALPTEGPRRVLIVGVDLPGMDGHTLQEQLHGARPGRFTVAFLSDRDSDVDQLRALSAGAVDYVVKPVSIAVLLMKISGWLRACSVT